MTDAQPLSALDASFLHLETSATHMHIGGVAIFERSPHGSGRQLYRTLVRAIEPRLDMTPRYRQKLAEVPFNLDTPVWVDDPDFDIGHHVRRAALPAPGGDDELQEFIAREFSHQLDRRRPLWEFTIIEGLKDGRWALLSKTHHALVDGLSSLELVTLLLDTAPEVTAVDRESEWYPLVTPSPLELLSQSVRRRLGRPAHAVAAARVLVDEPRRLTDSLRDTASGISQMAQKMRGNAGGPINGANSPARRYRFARFPLADFKIAKNEFGGTINDVVLTVVTGGLRRLLLARGLDPEHEDLRAMCPVSIRDTSEKAAFGNRLAMLIVDLPLWADDPVARMQEVRAEVDHLKERKQAVGADFLLNLAGFAPPTLHAMVARTSLRQLGFNLIVTNIPGPQFPLYCQGARLVEAFPVAFLYERQHVAVAIFSYCGYLNLGVLGDAHGVPDLDVLVEGISESLRELVVAAGASSVARADDTVGMDAVAPARARPRRARAAAGAGQDAAGAVVENRTTVPRKRSRKSPARTQKA